MFIPLAVVMECVRCLGPRALYLNFQGQAVQDILLLRATLPVNQGTWTHIYYIFMCRNIISKSVNLQNFEYHLQLCLLPIYFMMIQFTPRFCKKSKCNLFH